MLDTNLVLPVRSAPYEEGILTGTLTTLAVGLEGKDESCDLSLPPHIPIPYCSLKPVQ